MNIVDLVVLLLAGAAVYRGWRRGFLSQVFELGGGLMGLVVGVALGPRIASIFTQRAGAEAAIVSLLVVFLLLSIGQTAGYILGHRFGTMAYRVRLGTLNQGMGSLFGICVTLVALWLVGSMLVYGPSREVARAFRGSRLLRGVNDVLPDPPNVLAYLRQYLNTSGFPQVFLGLPPPIGEPVDLPRTGDSNRAARAADQSTVRVVAVACGGTQLGSGWVVSDGYAVTNAHVVAGSSAVTIQDSGGDHGGRVVLFDPRTDVAIVLVEDLAGPPLRLTTEAQERGRGGATLGYPGGRELRTHRAAVQDSYTATGADIYGQPGARRDIYELRSPVRQGDSGGPFVLPNGSVAGVVFAASTTDPGTGYALTGDEVADEIDAGLGRSEAVGTGRCTH